MDVLGPSCPRFSDTPGEGKPADSSSFTLALLLAESGGSLIFYVHILIVLLLPVPCVIWLQGFRMGQMLCIRSRRCT